MQAEIIAIGSELLGASRLDTNSLYLTRELAALGIPVVRKCIVPDDAAAIAQAIAESSARSQLVICTGGLGPTEDDRTRPAAAAALACALERDPAVVEALRKRYPQRNSAILELNFHQADRLAPAEWLPNALGSAPGQWCPTPSGYLALLPGPPTEMQAMFELHLRSRLAALAPGQAFFTRVLSIFGMTEAQVDSIAAPIYRRYSNPQTTILYTAAPQVELHFQASGATIGDAQARADALAAEIEPLLGAAVFSRQQESLPAVVGNLLLARNQTLAVAESCTGGLLGARLTETPGSSAYFLGGVECYSNASKVNLLHVEPSTLDTAGAVSAACARELAAGVLDAFPADWSLSITGIAGPDGGTEAKPVGTVFIGLAHRGAAPDAIELHLRGQRDLIRRLSVQNALNLLRHRLLSTPAASTP